MNKVIIFGTGEIAQLANYYLTNDSNYEVTAFTVDGDYVKENTFEGRPVIPFEMVAFTYPPTEYSMFVALSYASLNQLRTDKYHQSKLMGYNLVSYVSSKCSFLSQFPVGDNCFILEDNTIQPFVKIGNNVTLWSGNHIGHHSEIRDHVFVSSHVVISGRCLIQSYSFLGVNATIGHQVNIGESNIIGAGSIVTKSTEREVVIVPSRSIILNKKSGSIQL